MIKPSHASSPTVCTSPTTYTALVEALLVQIVALVSTFGTALPGLALGWASMEIIDRVAGRQVGGMYFDPAAVATATVVYQRVLMALSVVVILMINSIFVIYTFPELTFTAYCPRCFAEPGTWKKPPAVPAKEIIKVSLLSVVTALISMLGFVGNQFGYNLGVRMCSDFLAGLMQVLTVSALEQIRTELYVRGGVATEEDVEFLQKFVVTIRFLGLISGSRDSQHRLGYWVYAIASIVAERILPRIGELLAKAALRKRIRRIASKAPITDIEDAENMSKSMDIGGKNQGGSCIIAAGIANPNDISIGTLPAEAILRQAIKKLESLYCVRRNDHAMASYASTLISAAAVQLTTCSRHLAEQVAWYVGPRREYGAPFILATSASTASSGWYRRPRLSRFALRGDALGIGGEENNLLSFLFSKYDIQRVASDPATGSILPNGDAAGFHIGALTVRTDAGTEVQADVTLLCTGRQVPNSEMVGGLGEGAVDEHGFVRVRKTGQMWNYPNIFALGDVSDLDSWKVAFLIWKHQAPIVANNLTALIRTPSGDAAPKVAEYVPLDKSTSVPPLAVSTGRNGGATQLPWVGTWGNSFTWFVKSAEMFALKPWTTLNLKQEYPKI
ncbi:Apoptosis-inducing factor 2 [Phlyctochytrium bullatum]|nr:Apoptosis-inducing factor 2 [Phlyctochytrium bullatum]